MGIYLLPNYSNSRVPKLMMNLKAVKTASGWLLIFAALLTGSLQAGEIHIEAARGSTGRLQILLDKDPSLANKKDRDGSLPLQIAVEKGNKETVKILIDRGAGINAPDGHGETALHKAAYYGYNEILKLLIASGANPRVADDTFIVMEEPVGNVTPLLLAIFRNHRETAELLIDGGADINQADSLGRTPLHLAIIKGHKDIVEMLANKKADLNIRDKQGNSPLQWAANQGLKETVELLISKGADTAVKDTNGMTPLHNAAYTGNKEIAELLLSKGADINTRDNKGATPLHWAVMGGQGEMAKILLEKSANANTKDKDGWSPLRHAAVDGDGEMVKALKSKGSAVDMGDISKALGAGKTGLAISLMMGDVKMILVIVFILAVVIGLPLLFLFNKKKNG